MRRAALFVWVLLTGVGFSQSADFQGLYQQGRKLLDAGQDPAAVATLQQALAAARRQYGEQSDQVAQVSYPLSVALLHTQDAAQAVQLLQTAHDFMASRRGEDSPATVTLDAELAYALSCHQEEDRAFKLALEVMPRLEKLQKDGETTSLQCLDIISTDYYRAARLDLALPYYQRFAAALPDDDPRLSYVLDGVGSCQMRTGQVDAGRKSYDRALALARQQQGADSEAATHIMADLGMEYAQAGRTVEARAFLEPAWSIEKTHPITARTQLTLRELAPSYQSLGMNTEALASYHELLETYDHMATPNMAYKVMDLDSLTEVQLLLWQPKAASDTAQQAAKLAESTFGTDSPRLVNPLEVLAQTETANEDYPTASSDLEHALQLARKTVPPELATVDVLWRLAGVESLAGRRVRAEQCLSEATTILQALPTRDVATGSAWLWVGQSYHIMGDRSHPPQCFANALHILEERLGPQAPFLTNVLAQQASWYAENADAARAIEAWQRALDISRSTVGPMALQTLNAVASLSWLEYGTGRTSEGRALVERTLADAQPGHHWFVESNCHLTLALWDADGGHMDRAGTELHAATALLRAHQMDPGKIPYALYTQAALDYKAGRSGPAAAELQAWLKLQRPSNLRYARPQRLLLSYCLALNHQPAAALRWARQAENDTQRDLPAVFVAASEAERLALDRTSIRPLYSAYAACDAAADLARVALRYKGLVMDSLAEEERLARQDPSSESASVYTRLVAARQHWQALQQSEAAHPAEAQAARERVDLLQAQLAQNLGTRSLASSLHVRVEDVQHALAPDAVLVEFIRYFPISVHAHGGAFVEVGAGDAYGAVLIAGDQAPFGPLGTLGPYRRGHPSLPASHPRIRWQPSRQPLARLVLVAVATFGATHAQGTRTIILGMDGQLNFVSAATLLTPSGQFLADRYTIMYVGSGRDLLKPKPPSAPSTATLVANPDFAAAVEAPTGPSPLRGTWGTPTLAPLPGTATEVADVGRLLQQHGWSITTYQGQQATETRVRHLQNSPGILHLATHGFFLDQAETEDTPTRGLYLAGGAPLAPDIGGENPMLVSGLALSGAQNTLRDWAQGQAPPPDNDGVLTALEVSQLDLHQTWLAVLSACDTGAGKAQSGEGVMGLRRGFSLAGVQNLLMTLWPVSDKDTGPFMVDFYRAVLQGQGPPQALAAVQRQWLDRLLKTRGLLPAVQIAGPFVLSFQGRL